MKVWLRILALVAVVTIFALSVWLRPAAPRTGADFLPADTPLFYSIPDTAVAAKGWTSSGGPASLAALMQTPAAKAVGSLLGRRWATVIGTAAAAARLADGEIFFAITGLQITPAITPQIAFGVKLGPHRKGVSAWVKELDTTIKREFPSTVAEQSRDFRVNYRKWRLLPGYEICQAEVADYLIVTMGIEPMLEIAEHHRDPKRDSLAKSELYLNLRDELPHTFDGMLVAKPGAMGEKFEPLASWLPQLKAIGAPFAGVSGIGMTQVWADGEVRETWVAESQMEKAWKPESVSPSLLRKLPSSCIAAVAVATSPQAIGQLNTQQLAEFGLSCQPVLARFESQLTEAGISLTNLLAATQAPLVLGLGLRKDEELSRIALVAGARLRDEAHLPSCPATARVQWREQDGCLWLSDSVETLEQIGKLPAESSSRRDFAGMPDNGWLWGFFKHPGAALTDHCVRISATRRGKSDLVTVVSPGGSWLVAWEAAELAFRQSLR